MSDKAEIEVKFALADPERMRARLQALGAEFRGERHELNIRLDNKDGKLSASGIVLRLRRISQDGDTRYVLTIKAPTEQDDPDFRIRREIELRIDGDERSILTTLEILGYKPYWRYEKVRSTYTWLNLEIVVDQIPFGWFMEIEGEPGAIRSKVSELGLNIADGITLSYQEIYNNVRQRLNVPFGDLTFENFSDIKIDPAWYETYPADHETE